MPDKSSGASAKVGYGSPPVSTRFKPGQSGNPPGRPKGSPTAQDLMAREARKLVKLKTSKGIVEVPKLEAVVRSLYGKAMEGDLAAARLILQVLSNLSGVQPETGESSKVLDPAAIDDEALKRMLARLDGVFAEDKLK